MSDADWHKCKFLESAENLKPLVYARLGRTPSTQLAREITACLQQGRMFYEAARNSPLEVRPLQQFYGAIGLAKALILGQNLRPLSTLPQAHGLRDVSPSDCRIEELEVKIQRRGVFQEFNNVVRHHNRICYFEGPSSQPKASYASSADSEKLVHLTLSHREILSRVPGLQSMFFSTFGENAKTESLNLSNVPRYWELRIDDKELFTDRESIKRIVTRWRNRFPFLKNWLFLSAEHAWGYSVLIFVAASNDGVDEFSVDRLKDTPNGHSATLSPPPAATTSIPLDRLSPLAGGYSDSAGQFAISPIGEDVYLSEWSLHFLVLFVLSSLVRYRTSTWAHAISRATSSDMPADDRALALIEMFLELNASLMPSFVLKALNPNEDQFANRI